RSSVVYQTLQFAHGLANLRIKSLTKFLVWAALVFIASARVPVRVNAKSVGEGISTSPVPTTIGAAPSRLINSRPRQPSVFGVFRSAPHRSSASMPFLYPSLGVVGSVSELLCHG